MLRGLDHGCAIQTFENFQLVLGPFVCNFCPRREIPRVDEYIWQNNANHFTLRACLCVLSSNQVEFDPADFVFLWSEQIIRNFTVYLYETCYGTTARLTLN